jgi:hypothetical protein
MRKKRITKPNPYKLVARRDGSVDLLYHEDGKTTKVINNYSSMANAVAYCLEADILNESHPSIDVV